MSVQASVRRDQRKNFVFLGIFGLQIRLDIGRLNFGDPLVNLRNTWLKTARKPPTYIVSYPWFYSPPN